jgi:hypothetical protein
MNPSDELDPFSANAGARKPREYVPRIASSLMGVNLNPAFGVKALPKSD